MTQTLSLDATLTDASWGLARIIRRRAPWDVDRIPLPMDTYFRSVRTGSGVDIYHFDSGVRDTHDEFGGRATSVYSAVAGTDNSHGTMTASMAAGGTVGIARESLIWSFRIQTDSVSPPSAAPINDAVTQALAHYASRAATGRPAVANFSAHTSDSAVSSAIADLIDAGMVVVASAGNEGEELGVSRFWYPALTTDVITVGGIGMADIPQHFFRTTVPSPSTALLSRTNYGEAVDILAPGQHARSAGVNSDSEYIRTSCSTSGAAGYVSGVVACMLQGHSRLTGRTQVQAVKAKLLANATTGKLRSAFGLSPLPDKILYLDPNRTAPETISGL